MSYGSSIVFPHSTTNLLFKWLWIILLFQHNCRQTTAWGQQTRLSNRWPNTPQKFLVKSVKSISHSGAIQLGTYLISNDKSTTWLNIPLQWYHIIAVRSNARLILGLHPANERCRYKVMPSLIGWARKPRISPVIFTRPSHHLLKCFSRCIPKKNIKVDIMDSLHRKGSTFPNVDPDLLSPYGITRL